MLVFSVLTYLCRFIGESGNVYNDILQILGIRVEIVQRDQNLLTFRFCLTEVKYF